MTLAAVDHVQLAAPPGSEPALRTFYVDALGMTEVPKPPALAARGGCWFTSGAVQLHRATGAGSSVGAPAAIEQRGPGQSPVSPAAAPLERSGLRPGPRSSNAGGAEVAQLFR